jgi:hypothetical protein
MVTTGSLATRLGLCTNFFSLFLSLTSRLLDPIKALGKAGLLGNLMNKFDGGVEVLDDLDDHWTAKGHKKERKIVIEDLQDLAADRSVRVTILRYAPSALFSLVSFLVFSLAFCLVPFPGPFPVSSPLPPLTSSSMSSRLNSLPIDGPR